MYFILWHYTCNLRKKDHRYISSDVYVREHSSEDTPNQNYCVAFDWDCWILLALLVDVGQCVCPQDNVIKNK